MKMLNAQCLMLPSDHQVEFFTEEHLARLAERVGVDADACAVSGKQSTDHRLTVTTRTDYLIPHSCRRHGFRMPDLRFSLVVSIAPAR
jgi:hypothetical protein